MAYPPGALAVDKVNATPAVDDHPNHHNAVANAVNDIVTELGTTPKGGSASLSARATAIESNVTTNTNNISALQHPSINAQTGTAYTPVLTDDGKIVTLNNAAAISVTLPTNASVAFPVGAEIIFIWRTGAGQPTISAVTPGTTAIESTGATSTAPKLRAKGSSCVAMKLATDSWEVVGDLA